MKKGQKTLNELFEETNRPNDTLISAYENRELVFFLGAGVSRLMGLPGWDELATELIEGAYGNYKDRKNILDSIKSSKEKITIAYRKYCSDGREKEFFNIFGKALQPKSLKKKENIYKILAKFHAVFLTTNYDRLFENELGKALCHDELELGIINKLNFKETQHLFYLHGKFTRNIKNNRNLVFTASSYVKKYNLSQTAEFLRGLFSKGNYVIVFIGYGLNEFELIDYIMTKSGQTKDAKGRVFTLEGFYSDQEEVFQARKEYFDDLNIELLPYRLDTNYYDELIYVLKNWLLDFENKTKLPALINDDINNYISSFSYSNATQILNILNLDNNPASEWKIIKEVLCSKEKEKWARFLFENNYFSWDYLYNSIQKNRPECPFLDLLIDGMKSDTLNAQEWGANLLDNIKEDVFKKPQYFYIVTKLVEVVLLLDDKHLKFTYFDFIGKMILTYGYRIFNYEKIELPRLKGWREQYIKSFLSLLSIYKGNIGNTEDLNFHYYRALINGINENIDAKSWGLVIDWLTQLFSDIIEINPYCLLAEISNIDNVTKTIYPYWRLLLKEYELALKNLSSDNQVKLVKRLFLEESETINKLAIFSCRKLNLNPNIFIDCLCKVVSKQQCYCELYMYLSNHSKLLSECGSSALNEAIQNSKFGWDKFLDDDSVKRYIAEQQLTLLKLLFNESAKKQCDELRQRGIKEIDPIQNADQTDYVRSSMLSVEDYIDKEIFKENNFIDAIKLNFTKENNFWHGEIIKKAIDDILLQSDFAIFKEVLNRLRAEDEDFINWFVLKFFIDREKLNVDQKKAVYELCLDILDSRKIEETTLVDNCFKFLSSIEISENEIANRVFNCLQKWCNVNTSMNFLKDKDCYGKFINALPYSIFRLLMFYWIFRRENEKSFLGKDEFQFALRTVEENPSAKYYLSYHFPTLCYVFGKQMEELLPILIYTNGNFDMYSFMFCLLEGESIYPEIIDFVVSNNIIEENLSLIQTCKDENLLRRFYGYFTAAYFFHKLDKEIVKLFYSDFCFVETYFYTCALFLEKDNSLFDDYICAFYSEVKFRLNDQQRNDLCDKMLHYMRFMTQPSLVSLNTYYEVMNDIQPNTYFMVVIEKLLMFFDIDSQETLKLIKLIIKKTPYFAIKDFQMILEKLHEVGIDKDGTELLNTYNKKFPMALEEYSKLAKLLNN